MTRIWSERTTKVKWFGRRYVGGVLVRPGYGGVIRLGKVPDGYIPIKANPSGVQLIPCSLVWSTMLMNDDESTSGLLGYVKLPIELCKECRCGFQPRFDD